MLGNVLLVDDSSLSRRMVKKCLDGAGLEAAQFHEASDGAQALEQIAATSMDLVVTDLNMPNVDGYALVDGIDFDGANAPRYIIVISSTASQSIADELMAKGVSAVVCKPISPDSIKTVLEELGLLS